MTYIRDTLAANENVLYHIKYFWLYKVETALYFLVAFVMMFINFDAAFILICWAIYRYLLVITTERAVTNQRVIQKKGIISRNTEEIIFQNIETVTVHQTVMDRLLNTGTVTVTGRGGIQIEFGAIDDPLEVKKEIEKVFIK